MEASFQHSEIEARMPLDANGVKSSSELNFCNLMRMWMRINGNSLVQITCDLFHLNPQPFRFSLTSCFRTQHRVSIITICNDYMYKRTKCRLLKIDKINFLHKEKHVCSFLRSIDPLSNWIACMRLLSNDLFGIY